MHFRSLLLAAAVIAVPIYAPAPASAQVSTQWLNAGGTQFELRIVRVVNCYLSGSRSLLIVEVRNKAGEVPAAQALGVWITNGRLFQGHVLPLLHPETLAPLPADHRMPTGLNLYAVELPQPRDGLTSVQIHLMDSTSTRTMVWDGLLASLLSAATEEISPEEFREFAGRYRTSEGTMLELVEDRGHLRGGSSTVGQNPQYSWSWDIAMSAPGQLAAKMLEPGGQRRTVGGGPLYPLRLKRLTGKITAATEPLHDFMACPIGEDESGWNDSRLRPGRYWWARLEKAAAKPSATRAGYVQLDATLRVWNLAARTNYFRLSRAWGVNPNGVMIPTQAGAPAEAPPVPSCASTTVSFTSQLAPDDKTDGLLFEGGIGQQNPFTLPWDVGALVKAARDQIADADRNAGATAGAGPDASARPGGAIPSSPVIKASGGARSAALGQYSNYGIWDFKIEELAPGPDGHWQAVVRVRDAATWRVGLSQDGVLLTLFDEDGRSVASNGILYRASVPGAHAQIEAIPQTMWMEKGDEIRVRLFVPDSVRFKPVRIRLGSGDRETFTRTFALPASTH